MDTCLMIDDHWSVFFLLWNRLSNESPGKFDVVVLNYQFDLKCDVNLWNWSLPKLDIQKSILGRRKLLPLLLQQAWLSGRENTCYTSAFAWLVGWFVGYTSTMNQRSFDVKRLREIPEPTGSIAFHCFNWTLSMSCAYQELWTLLKWKRWEQSLEPSRRSWNRRPRGNEMHCRHSFWPNHFVFWVSIYLYVLDYKIWYHEYI